MKPNMLMMAACVWLGVAAATVAAEPKMRAFDALAPAAPGSVRIEGYLGEKIDQCIRNRVLAQEIEPLIFPYREKKEVGSDGWRCEYWGKWFTSLALADAYHSTPATRAKLEEAEKALLATAAPDGYLGTREPEHRLKGWDVWGRKYALLGVLAYYDRTGDKAALEAARRHLDTLIAEAGPGKTNIADLGEHKGLAASSILEPTVELYQRGGGDKYLDFARYIVGQWSKPSNHRPECLNGLRLIEDSLAGIEPRKMRWNKAYEMMSCFEGLCELYRATGDTRYRDAAVKHGEGILENEVTIVGPGTRIEHWFGGKRAQTTAVNRPMETCVTATWMKFCHQLLRLTGDVRYADELEKNLYNGLVAAMMPEGKWWAYFSGINGERVPSDMQHFDSALSCCVVSGPRALLLTPQWAVMTSAQGPVVNLYFKGAARAAAPSGRRVLIGQKTDYPAGGSVLLTVQPERPEEFTLALRIPAWSAVTKLQVNGRNIEARPGEYARITRTWKPGDRVRLLLDMRGRIIQAPDENGQVAVARGPLVLSIDDRAVAARPGSQAVIDADSAPHIELKPNAKAAAQLGALVAFDVPFRINRKRQTLTMCDYASAGALWSERNRYRTWLPQPLDMGRVFESGQEWKILTHRPYRPEPPPYAW